MKIRSEASVISSTGILQVLLIVVLYSSVICFFKEELSIYGEIEIRVGTFIPVVGGILFGMPGAIGAFIGNCFTYFIYDSDLLFNIFCSINNFLSAYGAFRLWYSGNSRNATFYVNESHSCFKFLKIIVFNAINISVLLAGAADYLSFGETSTDKIFIDFANNFDYPLLFAIPALWLWGRLIKARFVRFKDNTEDAVTLENITNRLGIKFNEDIKLFLYIILFGLEAGFVLQVYCNCVNYYYAWLTLILGNLIWLLIILQPSTYMPNEKEETGYRFIFGSFNQRILMGCSAIVVLSLIQDIIYNGKQLILLHNYESWLLLYVMLTLLLIGLSFSLYIIIRSIERRTVKKWNIIIAEAGHYADSAGKISQDNYNKLLQVSPVNSEQYVDELDILQMNIGTIEKNIHKNIDKLSNTLRERNSIEAKLKIATNIQQGVLPDLTALAGKLQKKGYSIFAGMKAAKFVGGDMYDCAQLDDDHVLIMVADVSGKGVPGALFMMVTQTLIKQNYKDYGLVPGDIVMATNDTLSLRNRETLFVTMWLGILELSTGRLRYTNAGHNPPILVHSGEAHWIKDISGPVLGLMDGMEYKTYELQLPADSKLLLYTDGINEAENGKGGFYGKERLEAVFLAADAPETLLKDINDFVDGAAQSDDMTYLWLNRTTIGHSSRGGDTK